MSSPSTFSVSLLQYLGLAERRTFMRSVNPRARRYSLHHCMDVIFWRVGNGVAWVLDSTLLQARNGVRTARDLGTQRGESVSALHD